MLALLVLLVVVVGMHLLVWSPLETWAERFHMGETGDHPRVPRMGRILARSRLVQWLARGVMPPVARWAFRGPGAALLDLPAPASQRGRLARGAASPSACSLFGGLEGRAVRVRERRSVRRGAADPVGLLLSFLRVAVGVGLAVLLSMPAGLRRPSGARACGRPCSPLLQILGSIPATAFFPLIAVLMVRLRPGDERGVDPARAHGYFLLRRLQRALRGGEHPEGDERGGGRPWACGGADYLRRVFVPAVLPSLVTGCVTAWGGRMERDHLLGVRRGGRPALRGAGIGATLDRATYVTGDLQIVTLSLVSMVALVVLVNRVFWDPLYQHVAQRYKLEA